MVLDMPVNSDTYAYAVVLSNVLMVYEWVYRAECEHMMMSICVLVLFEKNNYTLFGSTRVRKWRMHTRVFSFYIIFYEF
jgi:hypothetical protein